MCIICQRDPSHKSTHRNATTFKPGPDRRRHVFTTAQRQAGFRTLMDKIYSWEAVSRPHQYAGAWLRVRSYLASRTRKLAKLEAAHGPIPF